MLRFKRAMTVGVIVGSASAAVVGAGPPPLDRPSPPPYCADGVCYPNATTWGHYGTRWRRWPTEALEPTPAVAPPEGLVPELPDRELPSKEDEDRAAPPPTKAAERAREEEEDEGTTTPPAGVEPTGPMPFGQPPGALQPRAPSGEGGPEVPTMRMPWDDPPAVPETETSPGPTGDLDPPPAPPFVTPALVNGPAARGPERPAAPREPRRTSPAPQMPGNDPPPAFPIAYLDR